MMMRYQCFLFMAIYIYSFIISASSDSTYSRKPNQFWRCEGCVSEKQEHDLYASIHTALHLYAKDESQKLSFLPLDMSWTEKLSKNHATVHVTVLQAPSLTHYVAPTPKMDISVVNTDFKETFFVIAALQSSETPHDKYDTYFNPRELPGISEVDAFLTNNPCWVPIYEPSRHKMRSGSLIRDSNATINQPKNIRAAILARLPFHGHYPTCMLYTEVTSRQSPVGGCPYHPNNLTVNQLSNIGFAHTVKQVVNTFIYDGMHNIHEGLKIFTAPKAELFLGRKISILNTTNGTWSQYMHWNSICIIIFIQSLHHKKLYFSHIRPKQLLKG